MDFMRVADFGRKLRNVAFALLTMVLVSGCYIVKSEVYSSSDAIYIDDLPGDYVKENSDETLTIKKSDNNVSYFFQRSDDGKTRTGSFIVIPFTGNHSEKICQIKYDDENIYHINFIKQRQHEKKQYLSVGEFMEDSEELAAQFGVKLDASDGLTWAEGNRAALRKFIDGHSRFRFSGEASYIKR